MKKPPKKKPSKKRWLINGGLFIGLTVSLGIAVLAVIIVIGVLRVTGSGGYVAPKQLSSAEQAQIKAAIETTGAKSFPCINNIQDRCTNSTDIGYYPAGFRSTDFLSDYVPTDDKTIKQIYGSITNYSDTVVQLKSTSGRLFIINFPVGTIAELQRLGYTYDFYNRNSTMLVDYFADRDDTSTTLQIKQIQGVRMGNKGSMNPWLQKELFGEVTNGVEYSEEYKTQAL